LQHHAALDLADGLGADLLLAALVRLVGVLADPRGDEVRGDRAEAAVLVDELVDGEADRVDLLERGPQLVEVPLGGVALGGGRADVAVRTSSIIPAICSWRSA